VNGRDHLRDERVIGRLTALNDAESARGGDVPPHSLSVSRHDDRDGTQAVASHPPPQDLSDLDHEQLPVRHASPLAWETDLPRP
jgi:hypothetical protein